MCHRTNIAVMIAKEGSVCNTFIVQFESTSKLGDLYVALLNIERRFQEGMVRGVLQITVDHPGGMNELQALHHVHRHVADDVERELDGGVVQYVVEAATWHELGDDAEVWGLQAHPHEQYDICACRTRVLCADGLAYVV